jgi:hypothetical protein
MKGYNNKNKESAYQLKKNMKRPDWESRSLAKQFIATNNC